MTDDEFDAFVRRFEDMVYGTAIRLLAQPAEAEDVSQTVFLKAFERFDQLAASPTAAGWLKTVTTNLCLNHLTRHRRRWRLFGDLGHDDERSDVDVVDTLAAAPPVDFERAENLERLDRALHGLPPHQRVPLVLFHVEGHSLQEIAAALQVSMAKLKTDMHRGRLALKRQLGTHDGA